MTLSDIFSTFTAGSTGFCIEVETHHDGLGISRAEIARIAERAAETAGPNSDDMAAEFIRIWEDECWWTDEGDAFERHQHDASC